MVNSVRFDEYVLESLMADLIGHDRMPSAYVVYLYLSWRASGTRSRSVKASHQQIANDTGLSKSAVQAAVRHLGRRKLLRSERASITATPEHFVLRPWRR
jgi:CRP-like cAMP-binding protein